MKTAVRPQSESITLGRGISVAAVIVALVAAIAFGGNANSQTDGGPDKGGRAIPTVVPTGHDEQVALNVTWTSISHTMGPALGTISYTIDGFAPENSSRIMRPTSTWKRENVPYTGQVVLTIELKHPLRSGGRLQCRIDYRYISGNGTQVIQPGDFRALKVGEDKLVCQFPVPPGGK